MNLLYSLYFALSLAVSSPPTATVVNADGDWSRLPRLQERGYDHLSTNVMVRLHEIASDGQCQLPGYSGGQLNLRLSFAAQFDPGGSLQRIVLPKLNCAEAEGIIGGALLEMVRDGDYRPTGKSPEGWYRGQFTFSFTG